jgi:hypothetical protein
MRFLGPGSSRGYLVVSDVVVASCIIVWSVQAISSGYVNISVEISQPNYLGGSAELGPAKSTVPPGKSPTYPAHCAGISFQSLSGMIW